MEGHTMLSQYVHKVAPPKVLVVEYDSREERKRKTFTDVFKARAFWLAKDKAGKSPKYVK